MGDLSNKDLSLVLSNNFEPLKIANAKRTMKFLCSDEAKAMDNNFNLHDFDGWLNLHKEVKPISNNSSITTARLYIPIPEILVLNHKVDIDRTRARRGFNRTKVFERDQNTCGYCQRTLNSKTRTIDHFIPTSKGGKTIYENVVTACHDCNSKKSDKDWNILQSQGWRLHHKMLNPNNNILYCVPAKHIKESWKPFVKK